MFVRTKVLISSRESNDHVAKARSWYVVGHEASVSLLIAVFCTAGGVSSSTMNGGGSGMFQSAADFAVGVDVSG